MCVSFRRGVAAVLLVEGAWRRSAASSRSICASAAGVRPEVWERESTFERGRESPLWRCSMIPSKKLRRIASVMQIKHSQVA